MDKIATLKIMNHADKTELIPILTCAGYTVNEEYVTKPHCIGGTYWLINIYETVYESK